MTLPPEINGRFKPIRIIGRGSFGEVWLCEDMVLGINLAIKFYVTLDARGLEEFKNEFKNVSHLNHPNLLRPDYYDQFENSPYLVMAYCPTTIGDKVGHFSEQEAWRLIRDISAGLAYLHANDIVHRDIKPDNILQDEQGNYVITDFGLSTRLRSTLRKASARQMKASNNQSGTIGYMAPEMFTSKPNAVKATDIWALGATIFELATGEMPFCGQGGVMELYGAELPILPDKYSKRLENLMQRCLSKEPWDRPIAVEINRIACSVLSENDIETLQNEEISDGETKLEKKGRNSDPTLIKLKIRPSILRIEVDYTDAQADKSFTAIVEKNRVKYRNADRPDDEWRSAPKALQRLTDLLHSLQITFVIQEESGENEMSHSFHLRMHYDSGVPEHIWAGYMGSKVYGNMRTMIGKGQQQIAINTSEASQGIERLVTLVRNLLPGLNEFIERDNSTQWVDMGSARYMGELKLGKPHGRGVMVWPDHDEYEGEFVDGQRHGQGCYKWVSGQKYEGQWKQSIMDGFGVMTYPDGSRYEGNFIGNKRHGLGKLFMPNGEWFEGEFRDDKITNKGLYYDKNGKQRKVKQKAKKDSEEESLGHKLWRKTWRLFASVGCLAAAILIGILLVNWFENGGGLIRVGAFIAPLYLAWYSLKFLVGFFAHLTE